MKNKNCVYASERLFRKNGKFIKCMKNLYKIKIVETILHILSFIFISFSFFDCILFAVNLNNDTYIKFMMYIFINVIILFLILISLNRLNEKKIANKKYIFEHHNIKLNKKFELYSDGIRLKRKPKTKIYVVKKFKNI